MFLKKYNLSFNIRDNSPPPLKKIAQFHAIHMHYRM